MISIIFFSVLAIAAADFDYYPRPTFGDVLKFYRPGITTYVVKRTYTVQFNSKEMTCIYNKVDGVLGNVINFEQGYTNGSYQVRYPVKVDISTYQVTDQAPSMLAVRKDDSKQKREYIFHFYDPMDQCAVITFKDYSGTWRCELHTWKEKAYQWNYKNCEEEYDYQCPGRKSHSVYLYYCPV
ncbi:uncharacterized protein LOC142564629 [Dermacentor variabilis]|uniref:uncharacterized protein LOC142564629 n=1 Tax=Dermacentor variabilis TaxID=34621 RepID=UPI003F5CA211